MNADVELLIREDSKSSGREWPSLFVGGVFINDLGPFVFELQLTYGVTGIWPHVVVRLGLSFDKLKDTVSIPGLSKSAHFPVIRHAAIRVGGAAVAELDLVVFGGVFAPGEVFTPSPEHLAGRTDLGFDGILGYDYLRNFIVTFDLDRRRFLLETRDSSERSV